MPKIVEKQTAIDGYENGLMDAKASKYKTEPRYMYLLDKADRNLSNHKNFPLEYPNPAAGLAYSFGAQMQPVLKIITARAGNRQLEAEIESWFFNVWLPQAELDFQLGRIVNKRPQKAPKITHESEALIGKFNDKLGKVRKALAE